MKDSIKWIIFFTLLCAVCVVIWVVRGSGTSEAAVAQIKRGGSVIETIDLSSVAEPYEFVIEDDTGYNKIRVEKGRIAVTDADCKDKICVNSGYIDNSAVPIVCLPHRLSITIVGGDKDIDAVAGGN